jgi:long-chain acyl-CoA synthetase
LKVHFHRQHARGIKTSRSVAAEAIPPPQIADMSNLVIMQKDSCQKHGARNIFGTMKCAEDGTKTYDWITYNEFDRMVDKFRTVLVHYKIESGDCVAIIANNRVEWAVAAYACNGLGAAIVPMYEAQREGDWQYIINDSDSKMIIAATPSIFNTVKKYIGTLGKVESVLCLDLPEDQPESYQRYIPV